MNTNLRYPMVAFTLLILAILACGNGEEAEKVGEVGDTAPEATVALEVFQVGDVVKKGDQQITLNSATVEGGILTANFTIENQGTDRVIISTLDFSARDDEGTNLDTAYFDCAQGIGGEIPPGDKAKGNVCFSGASLPAKVYYEAELFGSDVVFEITE